MKYALLLRMEDLRLLSRLIQSAIDGDECIESDEHLEQTEHILSVVNRLLLVLGDFE